MATAKPSADSLDVQSPKERGWMRRGLRVIVPDTAPELDTRAAAALLALLRTADSAREAEEGDRAA
jgi:uncharacterized phage protein gp47/JayE